ncbi:hypothetical protein [Stappia sp. P2PMeth1]|uniref:hypothetical protein n=1 Tax=Stappia sp. P2PMeth1 TaxID=2003586 RepID=UPI00164737B7|nr:hypothetical protein [Stappia sp. P2PMeth1]
MEDGRPDAKPDRAGSVLKHIDSVLKLSAAALLLVGLSSAVPGVSGAVKVVYGTLFGITGAVFYEIGQNGNPTGGTEGSHLHLLRGGARSYDDLRWGDVLQAGGTQYFRDLTTPSDSPSYRDRPRIFVLRRGECVVVRRRINDASVSTSPNSGGWLKVSTVACGLFN